MMTTDMLKAVTALGFVEALVFVALGAADEGEQGLPCRTGIEPLGETYRHRTEWQCRACVAPKNAPAPQRHENWIGGGFARSAGPTTEPAPESGVVAGHLPVRCVFFNTEHTERASSTETGADDDMHDLESIYPSPVSSHSIDLLNSRLIASRTSTPISP
jgi:hypothetical protein